MPQIETLTTVWDARYDKLEQKLNNVIRANYGAAAKVEAAWGKANDNLDATFGKSGAGLRGFGAASLAAAVGATAGAAAVGALVAAFAQARQAANFTAQLADTADKVHLTTDALQEYEYALGKAGGQSADAADALNSFNETLGKAQAGVKAALKPFEELGFKPAQVKSLKDADEALAAVTARIQGLPNQQQDAVIQQLGLEKMAPLIREGTEEMARLRAEAHQVGVVMDADLIKRGAELNDQFETVSKVIDIQLKSALVDLGPILVGLLGLVADLARAAASVADAFRSVQNKTLEGLRDRRVSLQRSVTQLGLREIGGNKLSASEKAVLERDRARLAEVNSEIARRQTPAPASAPTRTLAEPSGRTRRGRSPRTPRDTTDQRTAQVEAQMEDAGRDLLQAWAQSTKNADQRAEIEKLAIDAERRLLDARIDKQQADILADKGLSEAKKQLLVARLDEVRVVQDHVSGERKALIDQQTAERQAEEAHDARAQALDQEAEILRLQEGLATTERQRREIGLKLLDLAEQRAQADLEVIEATKGVASAEAERARQAVADLKARRPLEEEGVRRSTQGPLEQFVFDNTDAQASAERFQAITVNAFDNLSSGIADIIANGGKAGDVLRGIVRQMLYDVTKQNLNQALGGLLGRFGIGTGGGAGGEAAAAALTAAGATTASTLGAAVTASGATAATTIGAAITTAGAAVATQIAAAMATSSVSKGLGGLGSLFGGAGGAGGGGGLDDLAGLYANGTDFAKRGLALVGERGPELVRMRGGEQVIPNDILRNLSQMRIPQRQAAPTSSNSFAWSGDVVVQAAAGTSAAENRRTGRQIAAEMRRQMAMGIR